MKNLNCFNFSTTLKSLSNIFNIPENELLSFLIINKNCELSEDELFAKLESEKQIMTSYDATIFFHLTRCHIKGITNILKNGLYSTAKSYTEIITFIYAFDNHNMSANDFKLYSKNLIEKNKNLNNYINKDKGPYALLINDINLNDYHFLSEEQGPEMVEDIFKQLYSNCYKEKLIKYNKKTLPVVVVFRKNIAELKFLKTALYFLWCIISNNIWKKNYNCSIDFLRDYGMEIKKNDILKIIKL